MDEAPTTNRLLQFFRNPALRNAFLIFLVSRLLLSSWAVLITTIQPIPNQPDEILRPYLGAPILREGAAGNLLGPWQRFDTNRYLRIAREGYGTSEDSVFPPLYPMAINALGRPLSWLFPQDQANLVAAIIISNLSFIASLALLFRLTDLETDPGTARRTVVYFAIFPTAFFLLAAYSESLFIALGLASIYSARHNIFWLAGLFGLLATLTRTTGLLLVLPVLYEYLLQRDFDWRRPREFKWEMLDLSALGTLLPVFAGVGFLLYRQAIGLPPISQIYRQFWYQETSLPGRDLLTALQQITAGGAQFRLFFDFFCGVLLIVTTWLALRRLPLTYGLYSLAFLLFIFLPTSELKPLFSFSRYVLAFFPTFILLGQVGKKPWLNRLIVYPSMGLYLYLSGQFFMWGWVA